MERTRRNILKVSTAAASIMLLPTTGSAQNKEKVIRGESDNKEIQFRGSYDDPLGVDEIEDKKDELRKKAIELNDTRDRSAKAPVSPAEGSKLVAYNCEIVDGVLREWIGSVGQPSFEILGQSESMDEALENDEESVKQAADIYAESVSEDPRAAKILASRRSKNTQSKSNIRPVHTGFGDWDEIVDSSYHDKQGGNECYWMVDWRHDPDNWSDQIVRLKTDMYPDRDGLVVERNDHCIQNFDFNMDHADEVEEINPGNTGGGQVSNTTSISVGSGGTVTVSAGSTTTTSDIEYNNKSYRPSGKVKHKTEVNNSASKNTVFLKQIASLSGVAHHEGEKFMGPTLLGKGRFNRKGPFGADKVKKNNYYFEWI